MPIKLGLARISRLLAPIPQPWKAIHIAGTNGKGSIAFYLSQLLGRTGVRAGVFTTPHLIYPRESIKCIRGAPNRRGWSIPRPISQDEYDRHMNAARQSAKELLDPDEHGEATEFEILTAAAFRAFAGGPDADGEPPIDVGVIECGVGGARDATNAMTAERACTVISSLSFDHQALLGSTLAEIAAEKAGIMRKDVPCFAAFPAFKKRVRTEENANEARAMLQTAAHEAEAPLEFVKVKEELAAGNSRGLVKDHKNHTVLNLGLAFRAFEVACPGEWATLQISPGINQLREDYAEMVPPGRCQNLRLLPAAGPGNACHDVLVDGAHNIESATVLDKYVKRVVRPSVGKKTGITWIIGMTEGRDMKAFIGALNIGTQDKVYAVTFPPVEDMPWIRPANPADIITTIKAMGKRSAKAPEKFAVGASYDPNTDKVLMDVFESVGTSSPIVLTGSLYLVSYFLRLFHSRIQVSVEGRWEYQADI